MKSMIQFCKKEAVLSIAVVLALLSVFFVRPDAGYLAYIDFRTLGILFCLMTIVAGLQQIGVFDRMAKGLLAHVAGVGGIVTILVLLCFFLSMLITNDVALITFVPLALIIMKQFSEADRKKMDAEVRCDADNRGESWKYAHTDRQSTESVSVWKGRNEYKLFFSPDASVQLDITGIAAALDLAALFDAKRVRRRAAG